MKIIIFKIKIESFYKKLINKYIKEINLLLKILKLKKIKIIKLPKKKKRIYNTTFTTY